MICSVCKDREAVVFMRHSAQATRGELALCEECASLRGLSVGKGRLELRIEDLLADASSPEACPIARCPHCGTSLELVRRQARIGCPACADAFRSEIERYMRTRSRPPYYRGFSPGSGQAGAGSGGSAASGTEQGQDLAGRLVRAIANEDYEAAAAIRDGLAAAASPEPLQATTEGPGKEGSFLDFLERTSLLCPDGPFGETGAPEADVVLETRALLSRNFSGRPFPGCEGRAGADAALLRPALETFAVSMQGCVLAASSAHPRELAPALAEAGYLPRRAGLDSRALPVLAPGGEAYLVFCQDSQVEARTIQRGLGGLSCLASVTEASAVFSSFAPFAFDEDFGFLAPSLRDCGTGLVLEALVHLPALAQEGLVERALKGLLARGFQVKGFYGAEEGSSGDLYLVGTEWALGASDHDIAADFDASLSALAKAERRARAAVLENRPEEVLDRAGRAIGLIRHCRFLGAAEAAQSLSALRMASLGAMTLGPGPGRLGLLIGRLGPAFLEYISVMGTQTWARPRAETLPGEAGQLRRRDERLRAAWLAAATTGAAIANGGSPCSRD